MREAKLRTERNTPGMEASVDAAFVAYGPDLHARHGQTAFEHGQWWITCTMCGAQWSVNDADAGMFSFEQVTDGDEWCEDNADREGGR